ncbi:DNA circularization N-terminal domain-containing protein [Novosphingobium sp. BL-8A]|uniref:DNA circularization protein n=1 Tax=Novosphingobium sp. BL-8A TaxID=3127639 RepID=UPI00375685DB
MLLPASFRGVPFAVTESDTLGGRRIALHQYPGRDKPWAEDMGRAPRRFRLRGFILDGDVQLGGLPVELQRATLISAIEKKGAGTLTHPTLGIMSVVVERASISEGLGANSYSDIELEFVESGEQTFPTSSALSTLNSVAAKALKIAAKVEGIAAIASAVTRGGLVADLVKAADSWANAVGEAVYDATAVFRISSNLSGNFGRYSADANSGLSGSNASPYAAGTTVADIVPIASANRTAVIENAAALVVTVEQADLADAGDVVDAVEVMIASLVTSCASPADAIRLLLDLMAFQVEGITSDLVTSLSDIVVRSLAAALTSVAATYQPQSADDAAARISMIAPALENLMIKAADARADESAAALRQCRGAIVTDLRNRGGTLARMRTFQLSASLPALTLAQNLYADATRSDQLVTQANPRHPLFMPVTFQALTS